MYKCKTYGGEMRQYLKQVDYQTLINAFLEEASPDYLQDVAVKYFSNPERFMISELEEIFS